MNRIFKWTMLCFGTLAIMVGCGKKETDDEFVKADDLLKEAVEIELSDEKILVNGVEIAKDESADVYMANDIVYYEEGKDFTYGEGTKEDEHSKEDADKHTVVHISKAGTYALSGELSYGQIAIDLGDDAKEDETAVVNLILNGVDINCDVAPAVIFYNVYECGSDETEGASKDVNTSKAGANVYIADGTENYVTGSHVAKIYKSYELSEDGTEVIDSKKLHKYDAAFYSKCTMTVNGGSKGTGILNILADNEGLDSELHLTINGGNINIESGNDGINTNEDEVSVTTVNGGTINILVTGSTGEGDGIDSNGWLVINGGTVIAQACSNSGDAGIDSDMGIHINGGTVIATGNMLDRISESKATYAVFTFAERQKGSNIYSLKNSSDEVVFELDNTNAFTYLIFAGDKFAEGDYTLWCNDKQCEGSSMGGFGMGRLGGGRGDGAGFEDGKMPRPEDVKKPDKGERPEGMEFPESGERPENTEMRPMQTGGERTEIFKIVKGTNQFFNIAEKNELDMHEDI